MNRGVSALVNNYMYRWPILFPNLMAFWARETRGARFACRFSLLSMLTCHLHTICVQMADERYLYAALGLPSSYERI
jgi:hypothetical protein